MFKSLITGSHTNVTSVASCTSKFPFDSEAATEILAGLKHFILAVLANKGASSHRRWWLDAPLPVRNVNHMDITMHCGKALS